MNTSYYEFIKNKNKSVPNAGFDIKTDSLNKNLFKWQKDVVRWALNKGKCALFLDTGLGKTFCQLEWAYQVCKKTGGNVLIFAPLAVSHQTKREGEKYGIEVNICRDMNNIKNGINIANYEIMDRFIISDFIGIVLDESSCIKHFGAKTARYLIEQCYTTNYRLCCTATPAPNDFMELGMHSEFLGVMKRSEMLSTFFVHDGGETAKWRLKGHAESEFWKWVASWACVIKTPGDLGYSDDGYILPKLTITQHIVESKIFVSGDQALLFCEHAKTLNDRRAARRNSVIERVNKAAEIANGSNEQVILWCDLNYESEMLSKIINGAVEVRGSDTTDHKTDTIINFLNGSIKAIISKSSIYGFGINLQNCHRIIFVGMNDSFESYYQAVRRCYRFGQKYPVDVHIITSESEGAVKANIERKHKNAEKMIQEMVKHTKDILKSEINQTVRIQETYIPVEKMKIPKWLEAAA